LVNVHFAAHDNKKIERIGGGQRVAAIKMTPTYGMTTPFGPGANFTGTFAGPAMTK